MANENKCMTEEMKREYYYILDQMCKYEKLSRIFKKEIFGKLGEHFEQKHEMYSNQFRRFAKEHEDILWQEILG